MAIITLMTMIMTILLSHHSHRASASADADSPPCTPSLRRRCPTYWKVKVIVVMVVPVNMYQLSAAVDYFPCIWYSVTMYTM